MIVYKLFREIKNTEFISEGVSGIFKMQITTDGSSIPNYEEITETAKITDWINCCKRTGKDYKFTRRIIKERFGSVDNNTWNSYSKTEKFLISTYKATDLERCRIVLTDDLDYWTDNFNIESIKCRTKRMSRAKAILLNSVTDVSAFWIKNFALDPDKLDYNYIENGIEGTTEGDVQEGLFNFILSTPLSFYGGITTDPLGIPLGKYENIGIEANPYIIIRTEANLTKTELVDKLINCLRYGIY